MVQHLNEPLRSYIKRFTVAFIDLKDLNESFVIQAFKTNVANERVHYALYNNDITSMYELVSRA